MKQSTKFYVASFLKNQTYFVPILVIFFQDLGLTYSQIFFVLTAGAVFSFVIEIPTGVFADLYGKRISIIISRAIIALSFLSFGFASSFFSLLLANLVYELGKSFRSGTETAYVFDYLTLFPKEGPYTKIKAMQKFYARISEALAASIGGFLAVQFGFSVVFFLATIPATVNFLQTLTWHNMNEANSVKNLKNSFSFIKETLQSIKHTSGILRIMLNITLLATIFVGVETFIQPYMKEAGLSIESFGFIYSIFLIIIAFLARFSSNLQEKFGGERLMNIFVWLTFGLLLIVGYTTATIAGVALLFFILMIKNLRSPIENDVFHERVSSKNRATMGSILALSGTIGKIALLPLFGFMADTYSIYASILLMSGITLLIGLLLYTEKTKDPISL